MTSHRREPTRTRLSLLILAGFGFAGIGHAQALRIEPSIETTLTHTSNAAYSEARTPSSDTILELTPGIAIRSKGARWSLDADARLQGVTYADGTQRSRILPTADVRVHGEAVERWLFLDTSLTVKQTNTDPFRLQADNADTASKLTTTEFRLAPYLERDLGSSLHLLARSDLSLIQRSGTQTASSADRDSRTQDHVVRLEQKPLPFGGSIEATRQSTTYSGDAEPAIELDALRAAARYAVDPTLQLGLLAGREQTRVSTGSFSDAVYGADLAWSPNERSTLKATAEHRFFGWGGKLEWEHRSPFLALALRLNREPLIQQSTAFSLAGGGDTARLLDALFTTRYPDPAARSAVVGKLIGGLGLPSQLQGPVDVLSQYAQLQQGASVSATFLGRLTSVTIGAYTLKLSRLQLPDDPLIPSALSPSDNTQRGVTISGNRRLSANLSANASWRASRIQGLGDRAGEISKEQVLEANLNLALSPKTNAVVGLRRRLLDSTVSTSSNETAGFIGMTHRF